MTLEQISVIFFVGFLIFVGLVAFISSKLGAKQTSGSADVDYYLGGRSTPTVVLSILIFLLQPTVTLLQNIRIKKGAYTDFVYLYKLLCLRFLYVFDDAIIGTIFLKVNILLLYFFYLLVRNESSSLYLSSLHKSLQK